MLVALAVSAIIIGASYASYEMVATQYKKNMDIADMHTSGRAIMRIIERDIRMAGFEYRDTDAKIPYGTISNPLTIKDSGNKCCDEVTVVYDYRDEQAGTTERLRIRYWTEAYSNNKGARHRLYKQTDVLGQNNAILASPIIGTKTVMADYIEDLQLANSSVGPFSLYLMGQSSSGKKIHIFNPVTRKHGNTGTIRYGVYLDDPAMTIGPNGLIYMVGSRDKNVYVIDPVSKTHIDTIPIKGYVKHIGGHPAIVSGPDGTIYIYAGGFMYGVDSKTKKTLPEAYAGRLGSYSSMTFGSDGLIYIFSSGRSSNYIFQVNPKTRKLIASIPSGVYWPSLKNKSITAGPDGLLYFIGNGSNSRNIRVYDPIKKSTTLIPTGISIYHPDMIFGGDGLIYLTGTNSGGVGGAFIKIIDPVKKKAIADINTRLTLHYPILAFKSERSSQESLVTIDLTLRTKNKYGKDRQFKKKDYHAGNYKIDKTDKYKRDTFSSTVLVRNLAL
jgi:type II secretory pathway component PulJ